METATAIALHKIQEELQRELDLMNENASKPLKDLPKNIFKTEAEADEFLSTPHAIENKMIKWEIRKDCYMVNTEDRITEEKRVREKLDKMSGTQRKVSAMLTITGTIIGVGMFYFMHARKRKLLELKLKYVNWMVTYGFHTKPSDRIFSILEKLANLKYQTADIKTSNGGLDVCIWLFGINSPTNIRKDLDSYNVQITIFLKNRGKKVRHMGFRLYDAKRIDKLGRNKEIKVSGKTGAGGEKLGLKRLQRALARKSSKPGRNIRNLYALTSIPNLREVLPPVEEFLRKLYPLLFKDGDYRKWTAAGIKRTLDDVLLLKSTLVIPPKQPLAIGIDETESVMNILIGSLKKWHKEKKKNKNKK